MTKNNITTIRETLLNQKSIGTFTFADMNDLNWRDEIRCVMSLTLNCVDYDVEDYNGQLKIHKKVDDIVLQKTFPRELTPLILHDLDLFLKKDAQKFKKVSNKLAALKLKEEKRVKQELSKIKTDMDFCNKLLVNAIAQIGMNTADKCNSMISKLTVGLKSLSAKYNETSMSLVKLVPARDLLVGAERDFYIHYMKMLQVFNTMK